MTILKDGDDRQLECEECSETTDVFASEDFEQMVAAAKAAGWKVYLTGGKWLHCCPEHAHGDKLARQRALFR